MKKSLLKVAFIAAIVFAGSLAFTPSNIEAAKNDAPAPTDMKDDGGTCETAGSGCLVLD